MEIDGLFRKPNLVGIMDIFGPNDIPIRGRNVVLLSSLNGRSDDELKSVLTSLGGEIAFIQIIRAVDTALICYSTEDQAAKAVAELTGEEIHFADDEVDDDAEPNLLLPARVAQFMTSPPPSPPEGWRPLHEDINRKTHEDDIKETPITQKKTLLLEKTVSAPRIVVEHD